MRRIYIAGFDVFYPDAVQRGAQMKIACAEHGWIGLFPFDNEADTPKEIFEGNLSFIRQADTIVANLNPFRGKEMDSGTAFEIGFAYALGLDVWGYLDDDTPMRDRLGETDEDGFSVENFGYPVNLMIAEPAHIVRGTFRDCLNAIQTAECG